jgi:hypothetical protein
VSYGLEFVQVLPIYVNNIPTGMGWLSNLELSRMRRIGGNFPDCILRPDQSHRSFISYTFHSGYLPPATTISSLSAR